MGTKNEEIYRWVKGDLNCNDAPFPTFDSSENATKSPEELFELFFDDNVLNLIMSQSSKYSERRIESFLWNFDSKWLQSGTRKNVFLGQR